MEKEKQIEEMAKIIKNAYSDCPLAKNGRTYDRSVKSKQGERR